MRLPLKVAYVSHHSHLRMGGQRSMVYLIEHLDRSKVQPLAICPAPGELTDRLLRVECSVEHIPLHRIKPRTLVQVYASSRRIRALLQAQQIDIISPDAARDAFTCGLAKLGTRTKMVWHVRLTGPDNLDVINQYLADGMIGDSDATRRRFSRSPRISAKYRTIVGGIDLRVFRPVDDRASVRRKLALPADRFILLFVGQIKEGKGVFDILDAMALVKRELPPDRLPLLLMIGTPVPPAIVADLQTRIAAGALQDHVRIVPQQHNIHEWMQAADALISGSHEGTEGMSRVLYEAMACGAAVIATDISGNREALAPESGILVPEKSPRDLARAVAVLANDPARAARYRDHGLRRAREVFDIAFHARGVEEFYFEVLGRKSR